MEKFNKKFEIDFDGKELFIAEESSSGCTYKIKNKKELVERIFCYVADCVDPDMEFDFELKEAK